MITQREILAYMQSGKPFSCKVVALDIKRKTGGNVIEYPEVRLAKLEEKEPADRPPTHTEQLQDKLQKLQKNPKHKKHFTRNIQILQDGYPTSIIKKIHVPLIIEFNGEKDIVV